MDCPTQAAGEYRQQNDNVQEGAEMVGGRVMPCQRVGFLVVEERGEPQKPRSSRPLKKTIQFIQEVLSWLEQSIRSAIFQDKIGI